MGILTKGEYTVTDLEDGKDAKLLYLTASSQVQAFDKDNKPKTTQAITISAKLQNASGTATFVAIPYIGNIAQTAITLGGTGNNRTLLPSQWTNTQWTTIAITATLGSLTDTISIIKVKDGITGPKGDPGNQGIPGTPGADGRTPYLHTAYAWSADGTDRFTTVYPGENAFLDSEKEITSGDIPNPEFLSPTWLDLTPLIDKHGIDQWYTISFDLASKDITNSDQIRFYPYPGSPLPGKYLFPIQYYTVSTEYQRFSLTFKPILNDPNSTQSRIGFYGNYGSGNVPIIRKVKFEVGDTPTIYTPAPSEDYANAYPTYTGTYTDYTEADSTNPTDYTWVRILGDTGQDGQTPVVHSAWSWSPDGTDRFTTIYPGENLLNVNVPIIASNNSALFPITSEILTDDSGTFTRFKRNKIELNPNKLSLYSYMPRESFYDASKLDGKTVVVSYDVRASIEMTATVRATCVGSDGSDNKFAASGKEINITKDWQRQFAVGLVHPSFARIMVNPQDFLNMTTFDGVYVDFKNYKVEIIGKTEPTVAPPYTPAPSEDYANAYPLYEGTYTDYSETASQNPADYTWVRTLGDTGQDGQTPVVHPGWSWSPDGTDRFTTGYPGENIHPNYLLKSTTAWRSWGATGGATGTIGLATDEEGNGIYRITVAGVGNISDGFGRATDYYVNSASLGNPGDKVTYSAEYKFVTGYEGVAIKLQQGNANGGWTSTITPFSDNEWHRIKLNFAIQGTNSYTSYYIGINGDVDGDAELWIRHPKIEKGENLDPIYTPSPSEDYANAYPIYTGTYTDYSETASQNPADYTWVRILGDTGQDGQTPVVHSAWSWSADGTDRFTPSYPGENVFLDSAKEEHEKNEFLGYRYNLDMAPLIDLYGVDRYYTLSFDLKGTVAGNITVYSQNGSKTKYDIGQKKINATTEYQRFSYTFKPKLSVETETKALLAFYGTFGTGVIPYAKNIKFSLEDASFIYTPAPSEDYANAYPLYEGTYTDYSETASTNPADYTWRRIIGESGQDGVAGKDGVGLKSTAIQYAQSTSGTTAPTTGWATNVPTLVKGQYLWTKTVWTYTDDSSETGYTVSYNAKDGNTGKDGIAGKDGVGISNTVIEYVGAVSGTSKPTSGWSTTIPTVPQGQYLWTRTTWTYTDGTKEQGYSAALMGPKGDKGDTGDNGQTPVVHPAWSWSADGTDRFTTVYPGENILVNSKDYSSKWGMTSSESIEILEADETPTKIIKFNYNPNSWVGIYQTYTSWSIRPKAGDTVTLSFYAKGNGRIYSTVDGIIGTINTDATSEWKLYKLTGLAKRDIVNVGINLSNAVKTATSIYVHSVKLEINGEPTIYTPSPSEDYANAYPLYEGTYTDYSDTASQNPADYTWRRIIGESGQDGVAGADGKGIKSTAVTYQASTSGTVAPTGTWVANPPAVTKGQYLWTRTIWTYTDDATETGYSVAYVAKDGNTGKDGIAGKDGVGIKSTDITYAVSSSGTTAPTSGWVASPPAATAGQFMWTKTVWTYTDDSSETGYSVGKIGEKGATGPQGPQGITGPKGEDGKQYYTWLKYADSPTTGMSDSPTNKKYMGLAYNQTTATESTNYADYTWSLIQGPQGNQGIQGPAGANGQPTYTWIKYGTSASGAGMSDNPTGKTYIGIAYNKTTATESTNAADYTWSLIQGPKGDTGPQGPAGPKGDRGVMGVAYMQPTQPSDTTEGATWFKTESTTSDKIIGVYTYSGGWQEKKYASAALAVENLSALSANLGNVTAGNITGVNINGTTITGSEIVNDFDFEYGIYNIRGTTTVKDAGLLIESERSSDGTVIYNQSIEYSAAMSGLYIEETTPNSQLGKRTVRVTPSAISMYDARYWSKFGGVSLEFEDLIELPLKPIPASSGFSQYGTSPRQRPAVIRKGRVVQLTGAFKNNAAMSPGATEIEMGVIPVGYRPETYFTTVAQGSSANKFQLSISPQGQINISRYGVSSYIEIPAGSWLNISCTFVCEPELVY